MRKGRPSYFVGERSGVCVRRSGEEGEEEMVLWGRRRHSILGVWDGDQGRETVMKGLSGDGWGMGNDLGQ